MAYPGRLATAALALSATLLLGAGGKDLSKWANRDTGFVTQSSSAVPTISGPKKVSTPDHKSEAGTSRRPTAAAPSYYLNWYSVNGGGAANVAGTNFRLGVSVGQPVAGFASGTNFKLGVGFWYGAAGAACPIEMSGDVNINGAISASDIIVLVNYVFKAGPEPLPCLANGDVNCNGMVSSSDIITLVISVFKAGPPPCNVCDLIPSVWSCP